MTDTYGHMFSDHLNQAEKRQANADVMAEILWRYYQPRSVIDLGCGLGFFLKACAARGAEISGVDGDWVDPGDSVIPGPARRNADLNAPYEEARRYELAATIEVAEHLKPERSEGFVDDLCALSDVVLFSAGIPDQAGVDHINLRFQGDWAEMFAARGYACYDPIRRRLAGFDQALPWLVQNVLLYVKEGAPVDPLLAEHRIVPKAASYATKWHYRRQVRKLRKQIRNMKASK